MAIILETYRGTPLSKEFWRFSTAVAFKESVIHSEQANLRL